MPAPHPEKDNIVRLIAEGRTVKEIEGMIPGVSYMTVYRLMPRDKKTRSWRWGDGKPRKKTGPEQEQFPVHPEVQAAKEELLRTFALEPWNIGPARLRLKKLLEKHHPKHSRPLLQRQTQTFMEAAE